MIKLLFAVLTLSAMNISHTVLAADGDSYSYVCNFSKSPSLEGFNLYTDPANGTVYGSIEYRHSDGTGVKIDGKEITAKVLKMDKNRNAVKVLLSIPAKKLTFKIDLNKFKMVETHYGARNKVLKQVNLSGECDTETW